MACIGRFAPSPSGRMHLGNVFSALLSWLSVKAKGGTFLLRIEDLDPQRCKREFADQVRRDLEALGLSWDHEQTSQSLRADAYAARFEELEKKGLVYPCYCSRDELHAASAPHASDGTPIYSGACRSLTEAERLQKTRRPAWRLMVPDGEYAVHDRLQGLYQENLAADCGDFIIRRSDGVYAYQLAVVTDDIDAGVTEVVRGRDLLSSTPRQKYLYDLFGASAPEYCHVPLLVTPEGRRLSKRERDLDLGILLERMHPDEIIGALLYEAGVLEHREGICAADAAKLFSWEKVRSDDLVLTQL